MVGGVIAGLLLLGTVCMILSFGVSRRKMTKEDREFLEALRKHGEDLPYTDTSDGYIVHRSKTRNSGNDTARAKRTTHKAKDDNDSLTHGIATGRVHVGFDIGHNSHCSSGSSSSHDSGGGSGGGSSKGSDD
ncbi:hypothetical protein D3C79_49370 [compost metagenome]